MNTKRIAAVVLCIALAFALFGCAQNDTQTGPYSGIAPQVRAASGAHGTNAGKACTTVPLGAANDWNWYMQDDKLLSVSAPVLMFAEAEDERSFPQAAAALQRVAGEKSEEAKRLFEELKEALSDPYVDELYSETDFSAYRSDSEFISVLLRTEAYLGGAHPSRDYQAVNLNTGTGETLDLADVVTDPDSVLRLAAEDLRASYPDIEFLEAPEDAVPEAYRDGWLCWTLGYEGISFHFAGGYFSSYADGDLLAFVPFAGHEELFAPEALSAPASYAQAFSYGMRIPDRTEGGSGIVLADGISEDPEYDIFDYVSVEWRGIRTTIEQYCYSIRPFYLHTEQGDYLYIETTSDNDYRTLLVFDLAKGSFVGEPLQDMGLAGVHRDEDTYGRLIMFDPGAFVLATRLDALSTYDGIRNYTVGGNGAPFTDEDLYTITGEFILTAIRDVPAKNADGADIVLPAGTELRLEKTDGVSVVYALTTEGTVRLEGQFSTYPQSIGGTVIEECFDGMMFAG